MRNVYAFVEKNVENNCVKYGMKLSEYADKVIQIGKFTKKGISAYLSPEDSDKFNDDNYVCLRISNYDLNIYAYNNLYINTNFLETSFIKLEDYILGTYEEPICLIYSSILPENISIYNKEIDYPLIIKNSKDYFYEKKILEFLEMKELNKQEVFLNILDLFQKSGILSLKNDKNNIKIYTNKKNNEKYIIK